MTDWRIFRGDLDPNNSRIDSLPDPPSWRPRGPWQSDSTGYSPDYGDIEREELKQRGGKFQFGKAEDKEHLEEREHKIEKINAALYLRRPLLVTGKPGTGKSTLIYAVAYELGLGPVLEWRINSRSNVRDGLYQYDAIGRLREEQRQSSDGREEQRQSHGAKEPSIGDFLRLGPLGTALLPSKRPRALLIDEIDKGDVDLPNDLLDKFEEGAFTIPELERMRSAKPVDVCYEGSGLKTVPIRDGKVRCYEFPFVVMTSNNERAFPAPFLRRCLQLIMKPPDEKLLKDIIEQHLGAEGATLAKRAIDDFIKKKEPELYTDQLLNAIHLIKNRPDHSEDDLQKLIEVLYKQSPQG